MSRFLLFLGLFIGSLLFSSLFPHENPEDHGLSEDVNPVVKKELEMVRIDERVGEQINDKLFFRNQKGEKVLLADLITDKPVLITFVYYSCPFFCQYVLQGEKKLLEEIDLKLGEDFDAITISFDHKDDLESTKKAYEKYTEGFEDEKKHWQFLYGKKEEIMNITSQFGFHFKWVDANQEYAHTAAIYVVTPEKKISRYFYGIQYNPFDIKLSILEAQNEQFRSMGDQILLYCYRYDSKARGYSLYAKNVMKAGGVMTVIALSSFLFVMFRREKNHFS